MAPSNLDKIRICVSLQDLAYDGTAPTLLYGYGGFNVDVLPTFSPFNLLFMAHFKGVYASANIRGGA